MLQLAAALLFTLAAGLGIAVILGMLKVNGEAVLSALAGEGAFPAATGPRTGPAPQTIPLRRAGERQSAPRPLRIVKARAPLSRAA